MPLSSLLAFNHFLTMPTNPCTPFLLSIFNHLQALDDSVRHELQNLTAFFGEKEEKQKDLCDTIRTLEEVVSTVTKAAQNIQVGPSMMPTCFPPLTCDPNSRICHSRGHVNSIS